MCKYKQYNRQGIALVMSLVFIIVFSSLAIAVLSMSTTNVQIASNLHSVNLARTTAESGCEYIRYFISQVDIPAGAPESTWFSELTTDMQNEMAARGVTNVTSDNTTFIQLGSATNQIVLDSVTGQSFWGRIERDAIDPDIINVDVHGSANSLQRNISTRFSFGMNENIVFDFGVASRGPVQLSGNIDLSGFTVSVEADVFIESQNNTQALSIIGNSQIAGDVKITNPDATVFMQGGQAGIGGETGQDAIDNHVETGVLAPEFPIPNPQRFEQYVGINVIDSTTDLSASTLYENIRIAAGTNPTFSGDVDLRGIVFIEQPNIVTFSGNTTITGIIVGNGDYTDNSGTNQIVFLGGITSNPVTDLPLESQYDGVREETGTFLMAPGFSTAFGGNFDTLNGAIAANGITFFGNAGGTIGGSVVNYSDTPMVLSGNSDLLFNRSDTTEVPAGFDAEIFVNYNPEYYSENAPEQVAGGESSPIG